MAGQGHAWQGGMHGWGVCMVGSMHGRGAMHDKGACVAGGMHGRGHAWQGVCMAGGHAGWGGACRAGGHAWWQGMHGRGHVWWGVVHGRGRVWQILHDTVNERAVRILLECILVIFVC